MFWQPQQFLLKIFHNKLRILGLFFNWGCKMCTGRVKGHDTYDLGKLNIDVY